MFYIACLGFHVLFAVLLSIEALFPFYDSNARIIAIAANVLASVALWNLSYWLESMACRKSGSRRGQLRYVSICCWFIIVLCLRVLLIFLAPAEVLKQGMRFRVYACLIVSWGLCDSLLRKCFPRLQEDAQDTEES